MWVAVASHTFKWVEIQIIKFSTLKGYPSSYWESTTNFYKVTNDWVSSFRFYLNTFWWVCEHYNYFSVEINVWRHILTSKVWPQILRWKIAPRTVGVILYVYNMSLCACYVFILWMTMHIHAVTFRLSAESTVEKVEQSRQARDAHPKWVNAGHRVVSVVLKIKTF